MKLEYVDDRPEGYLGPPPTGNPGNPGAPERRSDLLLICSVVPSRIFKSACCTPYTCKLHQSDDVQGDSAKT